MNRLRRRHESTGIRQGVDWGRGLLGSSSTKISRYEPCLRPTPVYQLSGGWGGLDKNISVDVPRRALPSRVGVSKKTLGGIFVVKFSMAKNAEKPPLTMVDPAATGVPPPRKLGHHGLSLWNSVQNAYRIDDAGGIELLAQCCAAQDRVEALAERINADGEVVHSRTGPKAHPGTT